jgi:UDPglucose 6-dehydrogenase
MRITIFGSGYVGLVTGACLADAGNTVVCVDVDARKIDMLRRGEIPIHEPGLDAHRRMRMARPTCATCWRWRGPSAST